MNENILKNFISKLKFVTDATSQSLNGGYEDLNIMTDNNKNNISGTIFIKISDAEKKVIFFETKLTQDDMRTSLLFETNYQVTRYLKSKESGKYKKDEGTAIINLQERDEFLIVNQENKNENIRKSRFLQHVVDNELYETYCIGDDYTFEKGIRDSFFKLNMYNPDMKENALSNYELDKQRRHR